MNMAAWTGVDLENIDDGTHLYYCLLSWFTKLINVDLINVDVISSKYKTKCRTMLLFRKCTKSCPPPSLL